MELLLNDCGEGGRKGGWERGEGRGQREEAKMFVKIIAFFLWVVVVGKVLCERCFVGFRWDGMGLERRK